MPTFANTLVRSEWGDITVGRRNLRNSLPSLSMLRSFALNQNLQPGNNYLLHRFLLQMSLTLLQPIPSLEYAQVFVPKRLTASFSLVPKSEGTARIFSLRVSSVEEFLVCRSARALMVD